MPPPLPPAIPKVMTPEELVDSPEAVVHMVDMGLPHEANLSTKLLVGELRRAGTEIIIFCSVNGWRHRYIHSWYR